jgi:phosphotriesterase-related protein
MSTPSFHSFLDRRSFLNRTTKSLVSLLAGNSFINGGVASPNIRSKKDFIPTLIGSVKPGQLGTTLMHEHVLTVFGMIPTNLRSASIDIAVNLLTEAKNAGVNTLVDMSPYRDIRLYRDIAAKTDINIIAATGYYLYNSSKPDYQRQTEYQMEERMLKEVTKGIDGTNIRAGIIKAAAGSYKMTGWEQMVFRAAARINKATGVPIATHACEGALEQFKLLVENGANPNQLNFAHTESEFGWRGRTRKQIAEEFLTIVKEGGYLLFNNFSCEFYTKWENMVYLMRYYCDKGYANRIFISEDCNWDWKNGKQYFEAEEDHPEAAKRTYAYLMKYEVPLMLQSGFTKGEIETFLISNPRNFFSK